VHTTHVPYAREHALDPKSLTDRFLLDGLAASCLEFQVEHGASAVIPPYFYAESPDDPAFDATVSALGHTARRMRVEGVSLPLVPLLCAQVQSFTRRQGWEDALDRFAAAAAEVGPQALALCLSPVGDGRESYPKLWPCSQPLGA